MINVWKDYKEGDMWAIVRYVNGNDKFYLENVDPNKRMWAHDVKYALLFATEYHAEKFASASFSQKEMSKISFEKVDQ
ncbi:MAG: hypothetical protein QXL17_02950 [Candidatus Thermoplasmatota archaeon]